jgi:GDPmannose 4,6-dehydratase
MASKGAHVAKKALITGITGQDGSYLAELLLEKGYEVHGLVRRTSLFNRSRIEDTRARAERDGRTLELHYGDLGDSTSLNRVIADVRPEELYNLAAQSHVGVSFQQPEYTADVCGTGVLRLLEALRSNKLEARFYQASTSELFGAVKDVPQNESTPFNPRSPYATAKLFAYWLVKTYRDGYGMHAANGILFNHESPRRGENFVTRKITIGIAKVKAGLQDVVSLGNLNAQRDWGFARDYVDLMWRMLQRDEPDDYVAATGETHSVREFVELAARVADFEIEWEGEGPNEVGRDRLSGRELVRVNPKFYRPAEVERLVGDASKARRDLGWAPSVGFSELVEMMVRADLEAAANGRI